MPRLFLCLLALFIAACASGPKPDTAASDRPITILVSVDGLRFDYLDRGVTPTLTAMAADGLRVSRLVPSFPSLTFPNHYTLVTGLHPDHHGIVGNRMTDPAIAGDFRLSDRAQVMDRRWWDDAEPIWVTGERAGLRTATLFWPGSEAPIHGVRPEQWIPFQQSVSSAARVDMLLGWLTLPADERPQFLTLYFDIVDSAGHRAGPESPEVNAALTEVDTALGRLREGLATRGLTDRVNIVVVADHGMAAVSDARVNVLDEMINVARTTVLDGEALVGLTPQADYVAAFEAALLKPHPHMSCWRKAEIPARLHYGRHRRVPPYVCLAEAGWGIRTRAAIERSRSSGAAHGGAHGYDPAASDMHAAMVASGPAFRRGAVLDRAESVDVHALLARLLGLRVTADDGDPNRFSPVLTNGASIPPVVLPAVRQTAD